MLKAIARTPKTLLKQLKNFGLLAKSYGQYSTIQSGQCFGRDGKPLPWYTYPCIEYLNNLDFSSSTIFEYGSGNSSLYWSRKAKHVHSVEHDLAWASKFEGAKTSNMTLYKLNAMNEYVTAIDSLSEIPDVVVVDGAHRKECVDHLLTLSTFEKNMILLDNSDWYPDVCAKLRSELNLIQVDFHGFGPINSYTWTTTIFFGRNSHFTPINNKQPVPSMASPISRDEATTPK